jgi:hypothetical protein
VSLLGADFVRVEGDKIRSVQGYFDTGALFAGLNSPPVLLNDDRQRCRARSHIRIIRRPVLCLNKLNP